MKYLLISSLLLSFSAYSAPSLTKKAQASSPNEQGMMDNQAITNEQMNTSPNPVPNSESEVLDNATLSNKPIEKNSKNLPGKKEIQAQEDAMDYSTTPKKNARDKKNSGVDQDNIGN